MNDKITTLIFDLGGVIINIDPSLTIKEFNLLAKRNGDILNSFEDACDKIEKLKKSRSVAKSCQGVVVQFLD